MFGHNVAIVALSALTAVSATNFTIVPTSVDITMRGMSIVKQLVKKHQLAEN